jgi:hypothetical protein
LSMRSKTWLVDPMPLAFIGNARVLYLHVPKTGGSSVEKMLDGLGIVTHKNFFVPDGFPCAPQHWHGETWEKLIRDRSFLDVVFMTVRHPLRRLESEYRYRLSAEIAGRNDKPENLRIRADGFSRWGMSVLDASARNRFVYDNHFRPQHEFEAFSPRVFRLEDGPQGIASYLAEALKLESMPVIGKHMVSPYSVKSLWTRPLYDRAVTLYGEDFERYGYSPDDPIEWLV